LGPLITKPFYSLFSLLGSFLPLKASRGVFANAFENHLRPFPPQQNQQLPPPLLVPPPVFLLTCTSGWLHSPDQIALSAWKTSTPNSQRHSRPGIFLPKTSGFFLPSAASPQASAAGRASLPLRAIACCFSYVNFCHPKVGSAVRSDFQSRIYLLILLFLRGIGPTTSPAGPLGNRFIFQGETRSFNVEEIFVFPPPSPATSWFLPLTPLGPNSFFVVSPNPHLSGNG